jgi:phosphoenolpyruvate carboxykinase (GTP)
MGDYFAHWIAMGKKTGAKLPKIYYVNWFRKSSDGKWLWPGYGDNSRVIKWIYERIGGSAPAVETPIGFVPQADAIDITGLAIPRANMEELCKVDSGEWLREVESIKVHYATFGEKLPVALREELAALELRLKKAVSS